MMLSRNQGAAGRPSCQGMGSRLSGKLESVFDKRYHPVAAGKIYSHHVEPRRPIFKPVALQKIKGNPADLVLLAGRYRFLRRTEGPGASGFYLYKTEDFLLAGDNINLTGPAAVVSAEDCIPLLFQKINGHVLAPDAKAFALLVTIGNRRHQGTLLNVLR
jgi:hypothetical protein